MIRSLRLFVISVVFIGALASPCLSAEESDTGPGTLEPTHQPMPPPEKKIYTTQYLFAVTRSITGSTLVPAAQVPLLFLAVPIDIAFLPIEAIAGFFRKNEPLEEIVISRESYSRTRAAAVLSALALAAFVGGCATQVVRGGAGTANPKLDEKALGVGLDREDINYLVSENIASLSASRFWTQEVVPVNDPEPTVAIWPIENRTTQHIEDQLVTILSSIETSLGEQRPGARGGARRAVGPDRRDPPSGRRDVRPRNRAARGPPARREVLHHRAHHERGREARRRAPPPVQPVPPGALDRDRAGEVAERGHAQQGNEAVSLRRSAALLCCAALATGCATYSDKLRAAHEYAARDDWPAAERELNGILGVDSREELPETWNSERSLGVLERSVVLLAQGAWKESARDLSAAESELEMLDFKVDTVGKIGTYVYSDSAEVYRASPIELTALNVINMINYLAMGDLSGAAVESRRYQVIRDYLETLGTEEPRGRLGAYLAGFVFEHLGESDRALRYYEDVQSEMKLASLDAVIARRARPAPTPEVLVVLASGRAPYKVPERMPIGAAIGVAGTFITGDPRVLQHSVFKVVVYPELQPVPSTVSGGRVRIEDRSEPVELVSDVAAEITKEYEAIKPRIIGAALSRMIARAAVSEGAMAAGRNSGGAGEAIGIVAGLGAEAALVALDKPDTRSWTFLPGRVWIARIPVDPGAHEVVIQVDGDGAQRPISIEVEPNGFAVVVVAEPR